MGPKGSPTLSPCVTWEERLEQLWRHRAALNLLNDAGNRHAHSECFRRFAGQESPENRLDFENHRKGQTR